MRRSYFSSSLYVVLLMGALAGACGDSGAEGGGGECTVGSESCECTEGGGCDPGLTCLSMVCVDPNSGGDGDGDIPGDGDGDGDNPGDGDGDNPGDGDGDTGGTPGSGGGQGDGDASTGGMEGGGDTGGAMGLGGEGGTGNSAGGTGPSGCGDSPIDVPITYRDFNAAHPDFGSACSAAVLVSPTLNEAGKPVYAGGAACTSELAFSEWFQDSEESATIPSTLALYPDGQGGYVNRWGPSGEQWEGNPFGTVAWCGAVGEVTSCEEASELGDCNIAFDPLVHECWEMGDSAIQSLDGTELSQACCTNCFCAGTRIPYLFDGNPLFFPLDGHPDALPDVRYPARLSVEYYGAWGYPWEAPGDMNGNVAGPTQPLHNFEFTAELTIPFRYHLGMEAEIDILKDDDAFVFVNGQLLIDLGGVHVPRGGSITFWPDGTVRTRHWLPEIGVLDPETSLSEDATTTAELGLVPGGTYEIKVFMAERKQQGSAFHWAMSGFDVDELCDSAL